MGKTVDLHASGLPRCVDAGSEASSNGVKLEAITRGRALRCVRGLGGARRYGVGHADGGRDNFLIDDRQYVGRGSALVHRVDERLLCVDKLLELEHRMFKLVQELCTCVVQELGVLCRGAGAERAKERVVFGDGVQSVGESNAAGLFVFFDGVLCCSWHQLVRMRGARRSRQDTQRVRQPGCDRVGGDTGDRRSTARRPTQRWRPTGMRGDPGHSTRSAPTVLCVCRWMCGGGVDKCRWLM